METKSLNLTTITCGENGIVYFWPFKEKQVLKSIIPNFKHKIELNADETINHIQLHRESGMLAISTDDFSVLIIDCDPIANPFFMLILKIEKEP